MATKEEQQRALNAKRKLRNKQIAQLRASNEMLEAAKANIIERYGEDSDTTEQLLGDIDIAVLDLQILLAVDAVLAVANDIEGALALELGVTLAVESAVIILVGTVCQGVGRTFLDADRHTLAILDIDSGAAGVGDGNTA